MQEVTLKNGSRELDVLVASTTLVLDHLLDSGLQGVVACYHLVNFSRDPNYVIPEGAASALKRFNLMDSNGSVHSSIRNIASSWARGEGEDMVFRVDPIKR